MMLEDEEDSKYDSPISICCADSVMMFEAITQVVNKIKMENPAVYVLMPPPLRNTLRNRPFGCPLAPPDAHRLGWGCVLLCVFHPPPPDVVCAVVEIHSCEEHTPDWASMVSAVGRANRMLDRACGARDPRHRSRQLDTMKLLEAMPFLARDAVWLPVVRESMPPEEGEASERCCRSSNYEHEVGTGASELASWLCDERAHYPHCRLQHTRPMCAEPSPWELMIFGDVGHGVLLDYLDARDVFVTLPALCRRSHETMHLDQRIMRTYVRTHRSYVRSLFHRQHFPVAGHPSDESMTRSFAMQTVLNVDARSHRRAGETLGHAVTRLTSQVLLRSAVPLGVPYALLCELIKRLPSRKLHIPEFQLTIQVPAGDLLSIEGSPLIRLAALDGETLAVLDGKVREADQRVWPQAFAIARTEEQRLVALRLAEALSRISRQTDCVRGFGLDHCIGCAKLLGATVPPGGICFDCHERYPDGIHGHVTLGRVCDLEGRDDEYKGDGFQDVTQAAQHLSNVVAVARDDWAREMTQEHVLAMERGCDPTQLVAEHPDQHTRVFNEIMRG